MKKLTFLPLLLLAMTASPVVFGQASTVRYSVATMADLEDRRPQPGETVEVRNGSTTNLWPTPRLFRHDSTSSLTRDGVYVATNAAASGRYVAADRGSLVFDIRHFGAIPGDSGDDTAAIKAAAAALQAAGGGTLLADGGSYLVRAPSVNGIVCYFTNLNAFRLEADSALFTTDDHGTNTFVSANLTISGTTATANTATEHGLSVGNTVLVRDSSVYGYDGPYTVATVGSATNFTFTLSGYSTPVLPATALIRGQHFYHELFRFKSCTNIQLGRLRFTGVVQPRDIQYRLGWIVANFREHCSNIGGEIIVTGAAYGIWSGDYDNGTTGDSSNFDVKVTARDVGYPVSVWGSGHDSRFTIIGSSLHRGMYAGGVRRSRIAVWLRNFDGAGVIVTHQPINGVALQGCENLDVTVTDTGTSEPIKLIGVGSTRYLITVAGYDIAAAVAHKNIRLHVYATNAPYTSPMLIRTYDPLQSVEGLTLSGFIDERGLSASDVRHDFYVDETSATDSGVFRDLVIRDFTVLSPADVGGYNATLKLTNLVNDVIVDNYRSGQARNFVFPPGRNVASIPTFPDWRYASFEGGQLQQLGGGVRMSGSVANVALGSAIGDGDVTLQWVGTIPASGNVPLWTVSTTTNQAAAGGIGASITNGHLFVRLYGATLADWRALWVTNWQSTHGGKVASLAVIRTPSGLQLWTDGRRNLAGTSTSGTAPAWTNSVSGTNWVIGADDAGATYSGTLFRAAAWNSDRSSEFPSLSVGWTAGQTQMGASTNLVDNLTGNGSFETLGGGGADVFEGWTESASGTSTLTASTNAYHGTNSMAFTVDGSNSIVGVTSSSTVEYGATYQVTFWAKVSGSSGGAVNVVGPADGEAVIQLDANWTRYSITKVWASTGVTIKRSDLASRTAYIDSVSIRRMGALADMDWTRSSADQVTGMFPTLSGGAASRMIPRGPGISQDRGDTNVTLRPGHDAPVQIFATAMTGAKTITLATDHAIRGDQFRIVRTGAGAGTLTAASHAIATDEWADFIYDGSAWACIAYGKIAGAYGSGGGTNSWKIEVNSAEVTEPSLDDTPTISWDVTGSSVTAIVPTGSITTNHLNAAAIAFFASAANAALTGTPLVNGTNFMALLNAKIDSDPDLVAISALTGTGILARTGAGTYAERTLTGDSEITVTNGNGVSGNPTLAIGAAIARVAAMAATYQPLSAALTQLATLNGAGLTNLNATTAFSAGTVPIARLASGTPDGTKFIRDDGTLAVPPGSGGGGNASTNVAQTFTADQTFTNITVTGSATMGDLSVASISPATAIPIIHGGSGATTAAGARTNFGLIIGSDVQSYSARLADIAGISYATGDLIYYDGANLVRRAIGMNGQVLGVSGGVLTYINQTGSGGGGTTNLSGLTGDVSLGTLADGQYLGYSGTSTKWTNRTPATNPLLVNWIGGYGIGTRTNYDASTNVLLASFSVPPSADPAVNGRYLSGSASMMLTNATVASQVFDFRILAAGVKVAETARTLSTALYETYNFSFRVVRESATTASIYADGVGVASSSTANTGIGTFGGQVRDFSVVATNAAWDWAATNSLDLYVGLNMSGTNTLIGVTRLSAGLYALVESSAKQPASSVLTNVASLTSGTSTNFLAGDGTFKQVTTNMIPGLVAALAAGGSSPTRKQYFELWDDFAVLTTGGATYLPWVYDVNSGGTVAGAPSETNAPGIARFTISTTGASYASYYFNPADSWMLGGGVTNYLEFNVRVSALSDGTDTYRIRDGFLDTRPDVESTDAVAVRYTHSETNGNWQFYARSNGTETSNDTGVAPSTSAFQTMEITVSSPTLATLAINGSVVSTITNNIPVGASRAVWPGAFGISRTSGTSNARWQDVDYYWLHKPVNR